MYLAARRPISTGSRHRASTPNRKRPANVILLGLLALALGVVLVVQQLKDSPTPLTENLGIPDQGSKMPVGDLPGWKQTGAEDFTRPAEMGHVGEVYGADLRGYAGFSDSSGRGRYTPDSVLSVRDGKLDFFLHTQGGVPRVASVIPFGYAGQKYGRYSIRFRYDSMPGYKIAFMLWPTSDDWKDGEIDWPEGALDGPMYGASAERGTAGRKGGRGSAGGGGVKFDPPVRKYSASTPGRWHVATTEWTPGKVRWFLDGNLVDETRRPGGVPNTPMRWTLQAETSLEATKSFPHHSVSGHILVDWAVQYAYVG